MLPAGRKGFILYYQDHSLQNMTDLTNWKPRPAPAPFSLSGHYGMIKPFRRELHQQCLWDIFGEENINEFLQYFPNSAYAHAQEMGDWLKMLEEGGGQVNIFRSRKTGDIVGMGSYMRPNPANGVVEIGSVAHAPAMARSPLSTEFHYLLARHAFEELGYRRYEWKCHNENLPSKRTAQRLGFTFEGVFRQHLISKGANRDTAWFSMIDKEWTVLKAAFEAWLSPDNFNIDGLQKQRLEDIRSKMNAQTG